MKTENVVKTDHFSLTQWVRELSLSSTFCFSLVATLEFIAPKYSELPRGNGVLAFQPLLIHLVVCK